MRPHPNPIDSTNKSVGEWPFAKLLTITALLTGN